MTDTLRRWHAEMTAKRDEWLAQAERFARHAKLAGHEERCRERAAGCQAFLDEVEARMEKCPICDEPVRPMTREEYEMTIVPLTPEERDQWVNWVLCENQACCWFGISAEMERVAP